MMQFIVLGYLPGTETQISFEAIGIMFSLVGFSLLCWLLYRDEIRLRKDLLEAINKKTL